MTEVWMQVTVVGLAFASFALAQSLHGSGYIAAFTGGMLFGRLASIVFAIIVINAEVPGAEFLALVVTCTVFLSLVAHGMSANPLAKWIGKKEQEVP